MAKTPRTTKTTKEVTVADKEDEKAPGAAPWADGKEPNAEAEAQAAAPAPAAPAAAPAEPAAAAPVVEAAPAAAPAPILPPEHQIVKMSHAEKIGAIYRGFPYSPDEDGNITVPGLAVTELRSHGFELVTE